MKKITGEVSPNYSKRPHPNFKVNCEKMKEVLPNVKIIYLVRDPIERAVSNYRHNWIERVENRNINKAFKPDDKYYLDKSRYYFQIEKYLKFFEEKQILIVKSEKLKEKRKKAIKKFTNS